MTATIPFSTIFNKWQLPYFFSTIPTNDAYRIFSTISQTWRLPFHLAQFSTNDSYDIIQHIFTTNNW